MPPPLPLRRGPGLRRRSGALLTCLALASAVLAGCSSSGISGDPRDTGGAAGTSTPGTRTPTRTTPTREPAPPPRPGECRDLRFGDIGRFSNDAKPTSCNTPHTALTFAVEKLPKNIAFDGVDIGNDAVQEKASLLCRADFARYIGGSSATRALSRLSVTYFLPTQPDFDAGSRWVRCDVIALQSPRILADLPSRVKGFNASEQALDDYGVCSRGEPGSPGALLVMCNQEHDYRALTALRLGSDSEKYPGENVVGSQGQRRCDDYISDALGLSGGYTYAWTYPSLEDWENGQRFGFCWNQQSD